MGEARRRGTFEERKAQAIAAGRLVSKRREVLRMKTREKQALRALMLEALMFSQLPVSRKR